MAGVVVATVVPVSIAQVPFGGFPFLAGAGSVTAEGGLVLPFAVAAAPLAALMVRRSGAWPVMFGGLVLIVAAAAVAAALPATALIAGMVSALCGSGAGMALPATAALAAGRGSRPGSAWWAAVVVASVAILPGLVKTGPATNGWQSAFGPSPLLVAAALAAALLYRLLADRPLLSRQAKYRAGHSARRRAGTLGTSMARNSGTSTAWAPAANGAGDTATRATSDHGTSPAWNPAPNGAGKPATPTAGNPGNPGRAAFPVVQRAQIAVLAPPAIALAALAVAVGGRAGHALAAVAVCEAALLLALAAMTARCAVGDGFAVACAMTGFVVAPASAGLLSLRATAAAGTSGHDILLMAGVIAGAALGGATTVLASDGVRRVMPGPVGGLLLVAGALVVACFVGPFANTVTLGLLVSGMLVGSLAAAIRAQLAGHGASAISSGLQTAYGWWLLTGAAVAVAVALTRSARRAGAVHRHDAHPSGVRPPDTRPDGVRCHHDPSQRRDPRHHDDAPARTKAPRHVARGNRGGAKVRPVSG